MGAVGGEATFTVTVTKKEVVAAVLPLQEHWLPFSNLDLLLPPVDVGVFFCYEKPNSTTSSLSGDEYSCYTDDDDDDNNNNNNNNNGFMVSTVLKKAMAQVLVTYNAFAGEVVANSVGEPELLCNNRGVEFFEGYADIELKDLNFYDPDQSVEGKLVPGKKAGVLAVQVIQLKCGGIVVGCTFDHRIADAYSANMFLVSWAETAQSKGLSLVPSFRRSLLNPRRPICVDSSLDNMYVTIPTLPPPPNDDPQPKSAANHLISRIYYVKADELNHLQSLASSNGFKRTKLESFCALLWQMIAKCANKDDYDTTRNVTKISKMGIVVDGRTRLSEDDSVYKATPMGAYFGNVLSIPYGSKRVDELAENPLKWIANEVHDFLQNAVTKEHFLGLIDWVEAHRPEPAMSKVYASGSDEGPAFVISSGQRFPVSQVDFGWGVPFFGSYHFPWGGDAGYVMPMPNPASNGDWIVYMHLLEDQMKYVEAEAAHLFRPLTYDYLTNLST